MAVYSLNHQWVICLDDFYPDLLSSYVDIQKDSIQCLLVYWPSFPSWGSALWCLVIEVVSGSLDLVVQDALQDF